MSELWLPFLVGCLFFPGIYVSLKTALHPFCERFYANSKLVSAIISEKCVSIIQAIMAIPCGIIIAMSCSQDILYDSHWLVNTYISFGLPYMLYDIYAMYVVHYHQNPHIWSQGALTKIMHYVKTQPAMILHHLALACLGYPIVMFYRNGKGDFFVGCFFSTELANPFIHLRAIFKQIGWQKTKLEILNGILLLITFFVGRLLLFPIMYHIYGRSKDLTLWEVPFNIPMHCNIGCATILSFQIYWLYLIVGATKRTLKSLFSKDDKAINVNSEGNVVMSVKQD